MLAGDILVRGHRLVVNDISRAALSILQQRIGPNRRTTWLLHDLGRPFRGDVSAAELWIDRAVLHFLVEESHIQHYFTNLQTTVKPGGHVLLAQFSTDGAQRCAGLDLHRYSLAELTECLGRTFSLVDDEKFVHKTPGGEARPYLYALFRRKI